ncbi:MAG: TSUP family transporter [Thermodesulfobacteriota bacterium]
MAGFFRHNVENVDFSRGSNHAKVAISLAICSIVGSLLAVAVAIRLPSWALKIYISLLVLSRGVILITLNKNYPFSWKKIFILGSVAAFNKGISGGEYGPVVTGGQLLSGIKGNNAVGITSLARGLTCMVRLATYVILDGGINWTLAGPLVLEGIYSIPMSALSVNRIQTHKMKIYIGVSTLILGIFTLLKLCIQ